MAIQLSVYRILYISLPFNHSSPRPTDISGHKKHSRQTMAAHCLTSNNIGIDLSPVLCYDPNNRTVRDGLYPQGIP